MLLVVDDVWSIAQVEPFLTGGTGTTLHTLTGHTSTVTALAVAPDGSWLASASDDKTVRIWDPTTGRSRHILGGHTNRVAALAVAPDGRWLASTSDDGTVRIWDAAAGQSITSLRTSQPLRHVVSDGMRIIVAGDRGLYFLAASAC